MGNMLDAVIEFMDKDGWSYTQKDETTLTTGFTGKNGSFRCLARVDEDRGLFIFYTACPQNAPEKKRQAISEFLTRANYGLLVGNFEMDFRDGEVRYKSCIVLKDRSLRPSLVEWMVYPNGLTMDKYFPGIMAIIHGNAAPEEAVSQIERGSE